MKQYFQIILIIQSVIWTALSLECYVCKDQDGNSEKCLKTIKTCEFEHDRCLSVIRWGSFPYWNEGAEKQYYISKRCATKEECDSEILGNMPLCHYIWYEDWKCAECCQGDRCNYYVTLDSSNLKSNNVIVILSVFLTSIAYLKTYNIT